jgi:hypothetical protein
MLSGWHKAAISLTQAISFGCWVFGFVAVASVINLILIISTLITWFSRTLKITCAKMTVLRRANNHKMENNRIFFAVLLISVGKRQKRVIASGGGWFKSKG